MSDDREAMFSEALKAAQSAADAPITNGLPEQFHLGRLLRNAVPEIVAVLEATEAAGAYLAASSDANDQEVARQIEARVDALNATVQP